MGLLAAHLTPENHRDLLDRVRHKSKRQTGKASHPLARGPLAITPPPARPAAVAPLAPERYTVQFTASAETYEKLRLAQALLRHQIPDGELGTIVVRALTALLADLAKTKFAATARPRGGRGTAPGSRHIPAEVPSRRALRRRRRIHGRHPPASD